MVHTTPITSTSSSTLSVSPSFSGQYPLHPSQRSLTSHVTRTFQVFATQIPVPSVIPAIHHRFNDYLVFDLNWSAIQGGLYLLYYFALEPVAAVS